MDPVVLAAALLGAVAVGGMVIALGALALPARDEVLDRARRLTTSDAGTPALRPAQSSVMATLLRPLARLATPKPGEELSRTHRRLVHAGYRAERAIEVFYGAKIALAATLAGGFLFVGALRPTPIPHAEAIAVVLAALGFYAPNLWLRGRVQARQIAVSHALPDALDLLVTCVEAGLGLEAAILRVTDEIRLSAPELAVDLRLTTMEISAGVTRADAFRRLAERTGLEELRSLSAILIQTEMFGTGIARALRVHSATIRTRRTHRAEERAATVAVKLLLPLIFCILPSLFAVIMGPAAVRIVNLLFPVMMGDR